MISTNPCFDSNALPYHSQPSTQSCLSLLWFTCSKFLLFHYAFINSYLSCPICISPSPCRCPWIPLTLYIPPFISNPSSCTPFLIHFLLLSSVEAQGTGCHVLCPPEDPKLLWCLLQDLFIFVCLLVEFMHVCWNPGRAPVIINSLNYLFTLF